ncbi:hypothetical protein [Alicyclobacillus mengziensis]|uniref:CobQ/CobB/MinD/ParA nucleotide binding domain-containing protein n=1 Tax=Alicyclobacillus mengziensis TaxID=2931921 RepID=A0A9X7Z9T6_9BACL|nr:hypothetical protein [Alicyclobacillus mengziensis]QSO50135.1 hypothetical protein JZ786_24525 [Alicyclobacillus mengziensis]
MKQLLLLIENPRTYSRITRGLSDNTISGQLTTLSDVRKWLTEHEAAVALVSRKFPDLEETVSLLERFHISVTFFEGDFLHAEAWLHINLPLDNEEHSEKNVPPATLDIEVVETISAVSGIEPVAEAREVQKEATLADESNLPASSIPTAQVTARPNASGRRPLVAPWMQTPMSAPVNPQHTSNDPEELIELKEPASREPTIEEVPVRSTPTPPAQVHYVEVQIEKPVYVRDTVPLTIQPKIIVVLGLVRGAGSSFISMGISHLLTRSTKAHSVLLLEHPDQEAYLYHRLDVDGLLTDGGTFVSWLYGDLTPVSRDGVDLAVLEPNWTPSESGIYSEALVKYLYRQLRRPFTIIDCGMIVDDMVLSLADEIYLIAPCDPMILMRDSTIERFSVLMETYQPKVLANKWTKHAKVTKQLFPTNATYVPFLSPDLTERAAWDNRFITTYSESLDLLSSLAQLVDVPEEIRTGAKVDKPSFFRRRKR